MIENFWEYLRMVSFLIVIISSTISYFFNRSHKVILIGNAFFALSTLVSLITVVLYGGNRIFTNNILVTPGAILWAIFNFINLLRFNGRNTKAPGTGGIKPQPTVGDGQGEKSRISGTIQGVITKDKPIEGV